MRTDVKQKAGSCARRKKPGTVKERCCHLVNQGLCLAAEKLTGGLHADESSATVASTVDASVTLRA